MFLEFLIKGALNIYYLRDEKGDHYYIDKDSVKLIELPYEEGIKYVDDERVYYETKKHIGILTYCTQDEPQLQSRIKGMHKPEHETLIDLAKAYNKAKCNTENCIIYEKPIPFTKVSIEPFWGLLKYKAIAKICNSFGGNVYLWLPRVNEKWYLKTGFECNTLHSNPVNENIYKIPIQIQYMYSVYKIKPKISLGYNFWIIKQNNSIANAFVSHTVSLTTGCNYTWKKHLDISFNLNSEYVPFFNSLTNKGEKFDIVSYSMTVGLMYSF